MAISIIDRVWKKSKAKANGLLLMLAIADHANENGMAWPGFRTLQQKTKIANRETITNNLRQLEIIGELVIQHNKGPFGTHWYHVCSGMTIQEVDALRVELDVPTREHLKKENDEKTKVVHPLNHPEVVQLDDEGGSVFREVVQSDGNPGSVAEPKPFNRHLKTSTNPIGLVRTQNDVDLSKAVKKETIKKTTKPKLEKEPGHPLQYPMMQELSVLTGTDINISSNRGRVGKDAKELLQANYTPEDLVKFRDYWKKTWQFQRDHQPPTLAQVKAEIGKSKAAQPVRKTEEQIRAELMAKGQAMILSDEEADAYEAKITAQLESHYKHGTSIDTKL